MRKMLIKREVVFTDANQWLQSVVDLVLNGQRYPAIGLKLRGRHRSAMTMRTQQVGDQCFAIGIRQINSVAQLLVRRPAEVVGLNLDQRTTK